MGMPCAGHKTEKDVPNFDLKDPSVSEFVENFGTVIPMGSKKDILLHKDDMNCTWMMEVEALELDM